MPGLDEVRAYMTGLALLLRGRREGFSWLDLGDRGMLRSFAAILWCLPAIVISWLWWRQSYLQMMPPNATVETISYLRLAMVEAFNWILPPLFAGVVLWIIDLPDRFPAVTAAVNWLSLPFSYANAALILLIMLAPGLQTLAGILWILLLIVLVATLFRLMRQLIGPRALPVSVLVLVLTVPSMMLTASLQTWLGLDFG